MFIKNGYNILKKVSLTDFFSYPFLFFFFFLNNFLEARWKNKSQHQFCTTYQQPKICIWLAEQFRTFYPSLHESFTVRKTLANYLFQRFVWQLRKVTAEKYIGKIKKLIEVSGEKRFPQKIFSKFSFCFSQTLPTLRWSFLRLCTFLLLILFTNQPYSFYIYEDEMKYRWDVKEAFYQINFSHFHGSFNEGKDENIWWGTIVLKISPILVNCNTSFGSLLHSRAMQPLKSLTWSISVSYIWYTC